MDSVITPSPHISRRQRRQVLKCKLFRNVPDYSPALGVALHKLKLSQNFQKRFSIYEFLPSCLVPGLQACDVILGCSPSVRTVGNLQELGRGAATQQARLTRTTGFISRAGDTPGLSMMLDIDQKHDI